MGWGLLILGVALWSSAHLLKRIAPEHRAAMGDAKGKGPIALIILGSIVLMVIGYRATPYPYDGNPVLWDLGPMAVHINNLLILIAIYMMSPAPKKGRLLNGLRHPMLGGFKLWAFAHLLVNGDLASVILFGGLLAWAVVEVITINRAEPDWQPAAKGKPVMDLVFLVASAVLMYLIGAVHIWLGYNPFGG